MGAKAWFAAFYESDPLQVLSRKPQLDRPASLALARKTFPDHDIEEIEDLDLFNLDPRKNEVFVGVYGDLKIIAHEDFGIDRLSGINARWHGAALGNSLYVHATHSVADWFAFALWNDGTLVRAMSVSPDEGILEDVGEKLAFEEPYWNGSFPADDEFDDDFEEGAEDEDPYPLPFHPLELAEEALLANLGFQFEGYEDQWICDPQAIPIMAFRLTKKARWKFWKPRRSN